MSGQTSKIKKWLWEKRNFSRLAFVLQLARRLVTSLLGLVWIRLIVEAMHKDLYDLYLAFTNLFSLGGLGDLGMGGVVSLRTGKYLGAEKDEAGEKEITKFLSTARVLFLALAIMVAGGLLLLFPWIRHPMGLDPVPGSGSVNLVMLVGAFLIAQVMFMSYMNNVNYACGNLTWPVIPALILLQFTLLAHWLLAKNHAPLWAQIVPYVVCTYTELFLAWFYTRLTHPKLAAIFPLRVHRQILRALIGSSFWVYLCTLGNAIYTRTDGLVIKAGTAGGLFAAGTLTDYTNNYKFCELMVFVGLTASFVSLPKITQWMASPDAGEQQRARVEVGRLNQFQTFLGFGAALLYLAGNSFAIRVWWHGASDPVKPASILLQTAFALNLAVTTGADAGLQVSLRTGDRGLRLVGLAVAFTGLLNLGLSILAMKLGWLWGIAMATVLAQSLLGIIASRYLCRHLKVAWWPWLLRACALPLAGIALAGWLRYLWPLDSLVHAASLFGCYAALLIIAAGFLGISPKLLRSELKIVTSSLRK